MKSIIGGRKYDTSTATEIDCYEEFRQNDWHYVCETLYRKKTGEFFLQGEGGPLSKYAHSEGNQHWSGSGIIPISEEEAREWCEKHSSYSIYVKFFGEPEE